MKLINTRYGVLNTSKGDEIHFAYKVPNYKNIALLAAIIAFIVVHLVCWYL